MSLDLAPIIADGFTQANVFIAGFGVLLSLIFGIGLFKFIFNLLKSIFANLG